MMKRVLMMAIGIKLDVKDTISADFYAKYADLRNDLQLVRQATKDTK